MKVITLDYTPVSCDEVDKRIYHWCEEGGSRVVCFSPVHFCMETYDNKDLFDAQKEWDMVLPDGMPIVWGLRRRGFPQQQRIDGPGSVERLCEGSARRDIAVGFYGGAKETLTKMRLNLETRYPALKMVYIYSPPFRDLTQEEDEEIVNAINDSGCQLLFVGLGCPKQERWMYSHKGQIKGVMLGVGAAFQFLAGEVSRAPMWMRRSGLEWLYRFFQEPQRLFWRYLWHNPRFLFLERHFRNKNRNGL